MKTTDLALRLTAFLGEYLPAQRNLSPNTIRGYRDAFVLLLRFCREQKKLAIDRMSLDHLDAPLVLDYSIS